MYQAVVICSFRNVPFAKERKSGIVKEAKRELSISFDSKVHQRDAHLRYFSTLLDSFMPFLPLDLAERHNEEMMTAYLSQIFFIR